MYHKIVASFIFISSFLFITDVSTAAFMSGNELLAMCESSVNEKFHIQKAAECRGYVTGVFDHFTGTTKNGVLCLNGRITKGQIRKIFTTYANNNPSQLNSVADVVVENSIYQAFKCKQKE